MVRVLIGCVIAVCLLSGVASGQTVLDGIINQTYVETFGRNAQDGEKAYWRSRRQDWQTKQDLINLHLQGLKVDGGLQDSNIRAAWGEAQRAGAPLPALNNDIINFWKGQLASNPTVVSRTAERIRLRGNSVRDSYINPMGRIASDDEIKYWQSRTDWGMNMDTLVNMHVQYVRGSDGAAQAVVRQTYLNVFGREPVQGEYNHWTPRVRNEGLMAVQVQAFHRQWIDSELKRMATDAKFMQRLNKAGYTFNQKGDLVVLNSGAKAPQPVITPGGGIVAAGGGNIVAAGGGNIVAAGGGNIVAAGGGNIVAAGGGNVRAPIGTFLIGDGGGTLRANGITISLPPN